MSAADRITRHQQFFVGWNDKYFQAADDTGQTCLLWDPPPPSHVALPEGFAPGHPGGTTLPHPETPVQHQLTCAAPRVASLALLRRAAAARGVARTSPGCGGAAPKDRLNFLSARARATPVALLAFRRRTMSHNICALAVGTVQHLRNHCCSLSHG